MQEKLDLRNFGNNLKRKIKEYNDTHEKSFQKVLDSENILEYNTIYRYFMGTKKPSLETLISIADILEVSIEDLLS